MSAFVKGSKCMDFSCYTAHVRKHKNASLNCYFCEYMHSTVEQIDKIDIFIALRGNN